MLTRDEQTRHWIVLVLIAVVVFFTNLGAYALIDEDEPKNAVCGREMLERGDWIVPTFNAGLRTDKPILIYWWMQLSYRCFGVSEFSARFGSSLLSVCSVLLTYLLGRLLYSPAIGFLASIILSTNLMFSVVGRAATPDATFVFCVTLAMTSFAWAVAARRGGHFCGTSQSRSSLPNTGHELLPRSVWSAIPMYAAMGLAVLAKGPVGALLPCAIIGMLQLVTMRREDLAVGLLQPAVGPRWLRPLTVTLQVLRPSRIVKAALGMKLVVGLLIILAVASPWYIAVGLQTNGAWLRGFLGDHNVRRFLEPRERHDGPFFYYLFVVLAGIFPWTGFLPLTVWRFRTQSAKGNAWQDSDRFLMCWSLVWLAFFSLASTKLPNYVLPIYPALALMIGRYLHEWRLSGNEWSSTAFCHCCRLLGLAGVAMIIGFAVAFSILLPGEEWLAGIGVIALFGAAAAYSAAAKGARKQAISCLAATSIALAVFATGIVPMRLGTEKETPKLAQIARQFTGNDTPEITVVDGFSPSLIYYAGHPIPQIHPTIVVDHLAQHPSSLIVTRSDRIHELRIDQSKLVEVGRCRRLLRTYDLVLLTKSERVAVRPDINWVAR